MLDETLALRSDDSNAIKYVPQPHRASRPQDFTTKPQWSRAEQEQWKILDLGGLFVYHPGDKEVAENGAHSLPNCPPRGGGKGRTSSVAPRRPLEIDRWDVAAVWRKTVLDARQMITHHIARPSNKALSFAAERVSVRPTTTAPPSR
jgi:hypothetical protein